MLWCRIKHVLASVCLTSFFVFGQAQAYEIPDGVDPATVLVGHLVRDNYETATSFADFEEQDVYASQLDQDGIFIIPDGYAPCARAWQCHLWRWEVRRPHLPGALGRTADRRCRRAELCLRELHGLGTL